MRTKFYSLVLGCAAMFTGHVASAQCSKDYITEVFQNVTVTTDTYSTANSTTLLIDVYQPTGDNSTMRPVMILAHGGSFIGGSKTQDGVVTELCNNFAKRGYVTASINYRLGQPLDMLNGPTAKDVVMKAISDGKAAIRFFRKDAATVNKYNIDPEKVFVGGNSAGAVLFAHVAFIDSVNEAPADLRTIINNNGGIEGNSGNDGYSSRPLALLNLAGGLNEATFVSEGNTPSFNAQGDEDATVPYNCANAQGGITPVQLCGLGQMEPLYIQYGINHSSIVYPQAGHCPWQSNAAMMAEIDSASAAFLAPYACQGIAASVSNVTQVADISVFPNPAHAEVNIRSSENIAAVTMTNNMGQIVARNNFSASNGTINTATFAAGIYNVKIEFANSNVAAVNKKVVIE
ncbi:MAG TPA: T9SS type A sorting domain-containing protein [Chitinophagales bacterium]|nr:T9SS type A sorting domain-containing protein [Chitinophagales bacterium]